MRNFEKALRIVESCEGFTRQDEAIKTSSAQSDAHRKQMSRHSLWTMKAFEGILQEGHERDGKHKKTHELRGSG